MDDQELESRSAPPATSEPEAPSQPLPPWQIPQTAQPQTTPTPPSTEVSAPGDPAQPGAEPPAETPSGGTPSTQVSPQAAGTPAYPPYPPSPVPTYPGMMPGAPSMPLTPAGASPSYPMYPAYPAYPTYPGSPSVPLASNAPGTLPPGAPYPEASATPYFPIAPTPYPYGPPYPALATIPLVPQRRIAQPFPFWLTAIIGGASLLLLVVAFLIGSLVGGQDWAASAFVTGIVAAMLALGAVALFVARVAAGRRASTTIALGVVGIVLLVSVALGGLAGSAPIHGLQAHALEGSGSWSAAIHEYALSGEHAPNAPSVARVYDEWGESLLQQRSFSSAVDRFNTVINTYADSGSAAVNRANLGLLNTYGAWVVAGTGNVPYATAIAFFESYAGGSACDATCQTRAHAFEAQGRFQYGQQLASQGLYQGAITQFEAIQSQFPSSAYAPQAHTAAAKAYLAMGQQQINSDNCGTNAVSTYQTLAKKYADTPEGKQAQAALKAPVTVTGHIGGPYPRNPTLTGMLSTHIDPNNFVYSAEYTAPIDNGTGAFAFRNVKQGTYNFSTRVSLPGVTEYVSWKTTDTNDYYFVHVGPLCTVALNNLGAYPSS